MTDEPKYRDPVRATNVGAVGSDVELILLFDRGVVTPPVPPDNQPTAMAIPSATVAMPWPAVINLHRVLGQLIEQQMKMRATVAAAPPDATKPN